MVDYLYTSTYSFDLSPPTHGIDVLVAVYHLGKKYNLPGLSALSKQNYRIQIKKANMAKAVFASVLEIYKAPDEDRGLRDEVVEMFAGQLNTLLTNPDISGDMHMLWSRCPNFLQDCMIVLSKYYQTNTPFGARLG